MTRATITMHLPSHRHKALRMQTDKRWAEQAYDRHIADYIRFLDDEGQALGFHVVSDDSNVDPVLMIDEHSHTAKKDAYAWLQTQPDIWNWMP